MVIFLGIHPGMAMIDRRIFLQLTGGAAAGAATFAPIASGRASAGVSGDVLGLVSTRDGIATSLADPLIILSDRLHLASAGRLALQTASVGHEDAQTSSSLILASEDEFADRNPVSLLLGGSPFCASAGAFDAMTWLRGMGGQALWDQAAARSGHKPLLIAKLNRADAHVWAHQSFNLARDFSGVRISAPMSIHEPLRMLGAEPTIVPTSEFVSAFQAGDIDAFETHDYSVSLEMARRWNGGISWATGSLAGTSRVISLRIPLAQWQALSPADQAIVEAVAQETAVTLQAIQKVHGAQITKQIARVVGRGPWPVRSEIRSALSAEAGRLLAPLSKSDAIFASALGSMTALVEPAFTSDSTGVS
jgi:TRAP-type mannitol/chloroaromatic compound transport system substrate-binding protein